MNTIQNIEGPTMCDDFELSFDTVDRTSTL